jgi:tetratricopeptide (TPR) repeat protein
LSQRKITLSILAVLLTAVILWQYPALNYQWHYQTCLYHSADHYPNIASLGNAPDRPTYNAQSRLQCQAEESRRRFEAADSTQEKTTWGLKAIVAYTSLIEDHQANSYRTNRAAIYAGLGQYEKSLADYDYQITTDPENYWMFENRARLYWQMGELSLALQNYQTLYDQALADSSNNSQAYLDRISETITELEQKAG